MQQFTNGCKLSHSPIITITFLSSVHFKFIKLRLMYSIEEVFVGAKKGGGGGGGGKVRVFLLPLCIKHRTNTKGILWYKSWLEDVE